MLVLSRRPNEELVYRLPDGQEIVVVVVDIRGSKVRLGSTAPTCVAVFRREVLEDLRRNGNGRFRVEPGHSVVRRPYDVA